MRGSRLSSLCALVIAAAIALAVGGCGGGGDSTGSGSETSAAATAGGGKEAAGGRESTIHSSSLSNAEFIQQAGAICAREKARGLKAISAYVEQHPGTAGAGKIELLSEAIQQVFLPTIQSEIDQIRALGAPAGEEQEVEAILDATQEAVDESGQGSGSNVRFSKTFAKSAKLAHEYGLEACAYG